MDRLTFINEVKARERQLYRIARSYLSAEADCADAVQEALTRAWARRETLRDDTLFGTWLTRILINECKTALRRRRRRFPWQSRRRRGRNRRRAGRGPAKRAV